MNTARKSAIHRAVDHMHEGIDAAADAAHDVADKGRDAVETDAGRISASVRKVQDSAIEAKDALVAGASSTFENMRDIAVEKADEARESLSQVGERIAATLDRASAEEPNDALKSRVLSSVAQGLTRASSTLRQRSVADLSDDMRTLAKRHPGAFMAAAAVVGFAAARFVRSSARRNGIGRHEGPQS